LPPAWYRVDVVEPTDAQQTHPVAQTYPNRIELKTDPIPGARVGPRAVAAADFDQDEDRTIDIAVANSDNDTVSVFLNDADSGWLASNESEYNVKSGRCQANCYPNALATGDLDGKNGPDIVATNNNVGIVSILFNNGNGEFKTPVFLDAPDDRLTFVIAGQFNDDNADRRIDGKDWLDLAVVGRPYSDESAAGHLTLLFNDGSGGFPIRKRYDTGPNPSSVTSGQFNDDNQDGRIDASDLPDLAVADYGSLSREEGSLWVFMNNKGGTPGEFGHSEDHEFSTGWGSLFLTTGDFDGLYGDDVAVANSGAQSKSVSVHLNDGTGKLSKKQTVLIQEQPLSVTAVDVELDGDVDLVTGNAVVPAKSHTVTILNNDGSGVFPDSFQVLPVTVFSHGQGYFATAANFDRDLLPDIVIARPDLNDVVVLSNVISQVPHFVEVKDRPREGLNFGMQPAGATVVRGDFNLDGVVDIHDIDLLSSEIVRRTNTPAFDLNADRLVDVHDLDKFLNGDIITSGNKRYGDADFNGMVQFPDFVILADNFGRAGVWSKGDFDGSGVVGFQDFVYLADSFGKPALAGAARSPVPTVRPADQRTLESGNPRGDLALAASGAAVRAWQPDDASTSRLNVSAAPGREPEADGLRRPLPERAAVHGAPSPRFHLEDKSALVADVLFAEEDDEFFGLSLRAPITDELAARGIAAAKHFFGRRAPLRAFLQDGLS
jgi:hypothetical protein